MGSESRGGLAMGASCTADLSGEGLGPHMFTLALAGEMTVPELQLQHDPPRLDGYRIFLSMKVSSAIKNAFNMSLPATSAILVDSLSWLAAGQSVSACSGRGAIQYWGYQQSSAACSFDCGGVFSGRPGAFHSHI